MAMKSVAPFSILDISKFPGDDASNDCTLNATGSAISLVCVLRPGETISHVGFTPTDKLGAPNVIVGVETLGTKGGSGTYKTGINSGQAKSAAFLGSSLTVGTQSWIALADPYRNTGSDPETVAVTIRYAGTGQNFTASHYIQVRAFINSNGRDTLTPYISSKVTDLNAGTDFAANNQVAFPAISVRDSDGKILGNTANFQSLANDAWDASATNDLYRGNVWTPSAHYRVCGCRFAMLGPGLTDFKVRFYLNSTLVDVVTFDPTNAVKFNGTELSFAAFYEIPLTPTNVGPTDTVRIVIESVTPGDTILYFPGLGFLDSANRLAFANGEDIRHAFGSSVPVWGQDTSKISPISPIIDQVEIPAGVRYADGLSGGMNN